MRNHLLILLARLIVAGVFVAAALPKLQEPEAFALAVESFRIIGTTGAAWTALALPWLELIAGAGLLLPRLRRASAMIICALLAAFIALHISAWARGLDIDCGCFGARNGESSYIWLIVRNTILLAILLPVLRSDLKEAKKSLASGPASTLHSGANLKGSAP